MKVGSFVRNSPCLLQVFDNMYDCFFMDALEKMRYLIYYGARVIDNAKALDNAAHDAFLRATSGVPAKSYDKRMVKKPRR